MFGWSYQSLWYVCPVCICLGNVAGWECPAWECGSGGALDLSSAYYIVRFVAGPSGGGGCPVCVAVRCFVSCVVGTFGRAGLGGGIGLLWFVYIAASFVGLFLLPSKELLIHLL
jgi:hypothetical protein